MDQLKRFFTSRLSICFYAKEQSLGRTSAPKLANNEDLVSESTLVACRLDEQSLYAQTARVLAPVRKETI